MTTFEELNLSEQLMAAINRLGFKEPTQIQRETIPLLLKGRDVIGESATGSGKTLAFGAGIIEKCEPKREVQAIILVPTRELAEQVKDELIQISYNKPLQFLAVYGGVGIGPQIDKLRKTDVVIATPGRLLDHMDRRTINTSKVKMMILDEADRMIEMGFIKDVEKIMGACPDEKQTLLFSATMYGPAKEIAKRYMNNPKIVHATKMVDPTKLKQSYYDISVNLKKDLLVNLLQEDTSDLVMVFCNTRRATDMLVKVLKSNGIKSAPIHGGLNQPKRLKTIEMFHKGQFQVLVCTDVAARGLHIEGVTHIYNYDMPKEPGDYVHRIGRTARAGNEGIVRNIITSKERGNLSRLVKTHRDYNIKKEESPELKPIVKNKDHGNSSRGRSGSPRNYQGRGGRGNFRRSSDSSSRNSSRGRYSGRGNSERSNDSQRESTGSSRNYSDSNNSPRRYGGRNSNDSSRSYNDSSSRSNHFSRSYNGRNNGSNSSERSNDDSPKRYSKGPIRKPGEDNYPKRSGGFQKSYNGRSTAASRSNDAPVRQSYRGRSESERTPPRRFGNSGGRGRSSNNSGNFSGNNGSRSNPRARGRSRRR